jgi:ribosomal protein S18 acetylase RimI-like enzyme
MVLDDGFQIELSSEPDASEVKLLNEGIERFNQSTPFGRDRTKVPLAVFLRHDGGVIGGAYGNTHYGWLYLDSMWVDSEVRGRGWGRRLMAQFEAEAVARGCHGACVDTYGFQAPGFYERIGYQELGRLEDFPPGSARHFYWKRLI